MANSKWHKLWQTTHTTHKTTEVLFLLGIWICLDYLPIGYSQFQAAIRRPGATSATEPATAGGRRLLQRPQLQRQLERLSSDRLLRCCPGWLYCGGHRAVWCCVPGDAVRLYNSRHLILDCISILVGIGIWYLILVES